MRNIIVQFAAIAWAAVCPSLAASPEAKAPLEHVRTEFSFTLDIPFADAAPLFGGWGERVWAEDYHPEFLYPASPRDQEGAVFKVASGGRSWIFMTTHFDLEGGRFQHITFLPEYRVTKFDITLARKAIGKTDVVVICERTAITAAGNQEVKNLAREDALEGERWRRLIHAYWSARAGRKN